MARSTWIAALAVILPGLAAAQDTRTHTVVRGNTLWGIAEQYLGDAFQWPRIHELNRERIPNPHRIFPAQEVVLPGAQAQVTAVGVLVQPGPGGDAPVQPMPGAAQPGGVPAGAQTSGAAPGAGGAPQEVPERTVFYRERPVDVAASSSAAPLWDVPPEQFYSAPWLIPPGTIPESFGTLERFQGGEDERNPRTTARIFDRLYVRMTGAPPAVGTRLQVLRVTRTIRDVGQVVQPTGTLRVEEVTPAGVVAVVDAQFDRISLGDVVRPLPPYTPAPMGSAQPSTGGVEATVLAYATDREVQSFGDYAFIDAGAGEGVRIGDEYVVVVEESPEFGRAVEGRWKVVAVLQNVSTARIVELENPAFPPGVRLRPDRRVR